MAVLANLGLSRAWARVLSLSLIGGAAAFAFFGGVLIFTNALVGGHGSGSVWAGLAVAAGGLISVLVMATEVRRRLARLLPIDPESPLHTGALVLVCLLAVNWLYTELTVDVLASESKGAGVGPLDLLGQELPLLILGSLGVGLLTRRGFLDSTRRLGLVLPAWWQVLLGLTCAIGFFAANLGGDSLQHLLDPGLAGRLNQATNHYYADLATPTGIAAVALLAGLAEEVFFRGALQPRLGLVLTALAFASAHPQYAVSVDTGLVLVLGFGLGLLRRYTNTTTSFLCHASYNAIVGVSPLLPEGAFAVLWTAAAGMAAVLLLALTGRVLRSRVRV